MKTLVDTSVFIEFFRGKKLPLFDVLLSNNEILLSRFVRLELIQGVRKKENRQLEYVLGGLDQAGISVGQAVFFDEVENLIRALKGSRYVLGTVDLLIAAEARLIGCPVYSLDADFRAMAKLKLIDLVEQVQ